MPSINVGEGKLITYDELGEGTPVIFIHPPGMGRHVFYYQRKLRKNMRIILPDLSGHGDSSRIDGEVVSIKYYSQELIDLLDELKIKCAVFCGYSAGGAIAQYISAHYKDRVKGLILFGGYPAVFNTILRLEHRLGMYMVKHHKNLISTALANSHTKNEQLKRLLVVHMNKSQQDVWYKYYQEVLHMNLINQINKISVPLLYMDGTRSDAINLYNDYFVNRMIKCRIVLYKHTNHQVPTKRWKQANEEITNYVLKLDEEDKYRTESTFSNNEK